MRDRWAAQIDRERRDDRERARNFRRGGVAISGHAFRSSARAARNAPGPMC